MQDTKHIVVIGASGGIGNKVAEMLLDDYTVTGTYFQHPEEVENLNRMQGFSSTFLDVKDASSLSVLSSSLENDIYAVINCAGVVDFEGEDLESDISIWNETLAVNLSGNFMLGKVLYSKLSANGRFIMISSTDSYFGGAVTASYAASKSGVNSLTKSFSLAFQDKAIRVNAIAPGWVETPMIMGNGDDFIQKVAASNPLKRNAQPIDVAHLIQFLLSDKADYINGQVIALEGGYTNQDSTLSLENTPI